MTEETLEGLTTGELPMLCIERTESSADFITKRTLLQAKGWSTAEAMDAMAYLLKEHGRVNK